MNANGFKFAIFLAIIIIIGAGIGCLETTVKTKPINHSQVLVIEGKEEWKILLDEYPLYRGVDFYKNAGFGVTKVTFEYLSNSGKGTILQSKNDIDWADKSKEDYYVSGIRLLLKNESGNVYDTGLILFQKDEGMANSISLPKEKFVEFKVGEIQISPGN